MDLSGLLPTIAQLSEISDLRSSLDAASVRQATGINDSAKPAALAALIRRESGPVLLITARPARAESLTEELTAWLGEDVPVLRFPERDALPYERLAPDPAIVRDRLSALETLRDGRPAVIVASALAVSQRTIAPTAATEGSLTLRTGDGLRMDDLLRSLERRGYRMEPIVQEPGDASRRGGIVDVFPPQSDDPLRIEFLGDAIESLRYFSLSTQRTLRTVDEIIIGPAQELSLDDVISGLDSFSHLNYKLCPDETRERFEEELTLLRSGLSFRDRDFFVQFLADATILDHLRPNTLIVIDEEDDCRSAIDEEEKEAEQSRAELESGGELPKGLPRPYESWSEIKARLDDASRVLAFSRWAMDVIRPPFTTAASYGGQLRKLVQDIAQSASAGEHTVIVSQQAQRLSEMLQDEGQPAPVVTNVADEPSRIILAQGSLSEGWKLPGISLLTDHEIFGFVKQRRALPRKSTNREAFISELSPGAYVVHIDHGIGKFAGLIHRTIDGTEREYLEIHYSEGDRLFVPSDQVDRVNRYVGPSDRSPTLTRLTSGEWQRATQRAKRAVAELAKELLTLYAAREALPGYAFSPDTAWQAELEASFPYVETGDQLAAITATKFDMETARPMDRLVCGDVGYGKTEVAIRAAFKAVMDGKQVAVLVPTTVLAQQHYETFRERLGAFPTRVDVLSRFRTDQEQRQVVESLAEGAIDIVIGTHRLIQKDVKFKDLGLVVVDEEQRFGVSHKEHLKQMRRDADVLTLSATPIPRTLYMALGGIRDMSTMETPPEERLPIKTYVSEFDERLVHEAVVRELERGGQVYFVHNRVHNITHIATKLGEIVPDARIGIGHGQMDEQQLARVMKEFSHGEIDVLVCTTIIESGLDIPNVNTILINQADKLGLSQLYQLRGRVGRGAHRAYAYLLFDKTGRMTDAARMRLQAIFEATELGAGFQIAMRDLEIRGAGNLLGAEQSGYMAAIGFDLYVRLLANAVERFRALQRGETPAPEVEGPDVSIDLPISALLPPSYVPDLNLRLALYQRLSAASSPEDVNVIAQEMVDRFGPPPPLARNLLYVVTVKALARQAGVQSIIKDGAEANVRLKDGLELQRETLESSVPRGVQVGLHRLRIDLSEGWRDRLLLTLEQLIASNATLETSPA
ncbi:MAG: transcription-repair coupling factor [Dehalococcoidia bacterium]